MEDTKWIDELSINDTVIVTGNGRRKATVTGIIPKKVILLDDDSLFDFSGYSIHGNTWMEFPTPSKLKEIEDELTIERSIYLIKQTDYKKLKIEQLLKIVAIIKEKK